eukprot:jgi/Tetstr1/466455/TSEL_010983.t1
MDATTKFSQHVYNLSDQFLPNEWIMVKWEEGYYITAMAGFNIGSSLVVMSKGTPYTRRSYKVGDCFASISEGPSLFGRGGGAARSSKRPAAAPFGEPSPPDPAGGG